MSEEETTENRLHHQSREALRTGRLPARAPERLWGGHGNGTDSCRICGNPLKKEEITFDLEYAEESGPTSYSVHLRCFNAWDVERQRQQSPGAHTQRCSVSTGQSHALPDADDVGTITAREQDTFPNTW